MTARRRESIEKQLIARERETVREILSARNQLLLDVGSGDQVDRLLRVEARNEAVLSLERSMGELRMIRGALQALSEGSYGICKNCEEPIPEKRLRAIPWAILCLRCQQLGEKRREYPDGSTREAA